MRAEDRVAEAVAALSTRGVSGRFDCALVLGTGLSRLADGMSEAVSVPFRDLPHFPRAGVTATRGASSPGPSMWTGC